jgi:hypothetical protein
MHPYKITSAHQLLLIDPLGRVEYSNWFQNNLNDHFTFFLLMKRGFIYIVII